jgi:hypothetical protein
MHYTLERSHRQKDKYLYYLGLFILFPCLWMQYIAKCSHRQVDKDLRDFSLSVYLPIDSVYLSVLSDRQTKIYFMMVCLFSFSSFGCIIFKRSHRQIDKDLYDCGFSIFFLYLWIHYVSERSANSQTNKDLFDDDLSSYLSVLLDALYLSVPTDRQTDR